MPPLAAVQSAEGFIVELLVAGALGHGLCHTTQRMRRLRELIFRTSAWLGGITGLLYAVGPTFTENSSGDFSLFAVALVGATTGVLATCGWYLAVAALVFVWQHVLAVPFRWLGRVNDARMRRRNHRNLERTTTHQQDQQAADRQTQEQTKRETERQRRDEQKRRDDARFACQMHYDRVSSSIRDQFSPARLQEYFERYLSDTQSAVEVEDRAAKLRDMLDELSGNEPGRSRNGASLAVIRQEYQTRRAEIQAAGFDPETATALLASLAREEERSIREFAQS